MQFDSIRPYTDNEVPAVISRLRASEELRDGFASFLFPQLYRCAPGVARRATRGLLWFRARKFRTVHDVQMMTGRLIDHMLSETVAELSVDGLDHLEPAKPYLFISNHRDITLDSALLNRVLHGAGFPTCQIAVGDNLFGTPFADDLMRLNRGFIVQRSAVGHKAQYAALKQTSQYIRHSVEQGVSVWIAQREGRAKDGFDRTDPALLKMLALAYRGDGKTVADLCTQVEVVPVSISYELDPCDEQKAHELWSIETQGSFEKAQGADQASIVAGVKGYKGRVHLRFAAPLSGTYEQAEEIARALDESIVSGLKVFPTNTDADQLLGAARCDPQLPRLSKVTALFESRIAGIKSAERPFLLRQYANVLRNRNELGLE